MAGSLSSYYKNDSADLYFNTDFAQINDKITGVELKEKVDLQRTLPENAWPTFLVSRVLLLILLVQLLFFSLNLIIGNWRDEWMNMLSNIFEKKSRQIEKLSGNMLYACLNMWNFYNSYINMKTRLWPKMSSHLGLGSIWSVIRT